MAEVVQSLEASQIQGAKLDAPKFEFLTRVAWGYLSLGGLLEGSFSVEQCNYESAGRLLPQYYYNTEYTARHKYSTHTEKSAQSMAWYCETTAHA